MNEIKKLYVFSGALVGFYLLLLTICIMIIKFPSTPEGFFEENVVKFLEDYLDYFAATVCAMCIFYGYKKSEGTNKYLCGGILCLEIGILSFIINIIICKMHSHIDYNMYMRNATNMFIYVAIAILVFLYMSFMYRLVEKRRKENGTIKKKNKKRR